ncbi:MAG: transferrin-binding protein-like solute binding protein [Pseudomonadota bacterium]
MGRHEAILSAVVVAAAVVGCSTDIEPSRDFDPAFFIGSEAMGESANGLPLADGSQTLSDVESQNLTVRLVRFERDASSGVTRLIATDETVTLSSDFTRFPGDGEVVSADKYDVTITIDGQPVKIENGVGALPSGQRVWSYLNYRLVNSGTGAIYTGGRFDGNAVDPIDMEGFYTFGFESDPSTIAAMTDSATYRGSFFGYSQTFDSTGNLLQEEVRTRGAVTLEAEFARSRVSGRLETFLEAPDESEDDAFYELIFLAAPITGNGFVGVADITCPTGNSCTSNTSVGGAFYGPKGEEVSGVIALDETVTGPDGQRIVGTAGFSTSR